MCQKLQQISRVDQSEICRITATMAELRDEKLLYNDVFSQVFSPAGQHLIAANAYGHVVIYDLSKCLGPCKGEENEVQGPTHRFVAYTDRGVYSMVSTNDFLVMGSTGEISGWDWKVVLEQKSSKPKAAWTVQMPSYKDKIFKPDVTAMIYSKSDSLLCAACGDNNIYIVDLAEGKIVSQLEGHKDYVHCLAMSGNRLASSGEDGSVILWDFRQRESTIIFSPHLIEKIARPSVGKWIGAVDLTEDWLVCGGGPRLSLWNLRTADAATIFDLDDRGIHVASIHEERVIAGGISSHLHHFTYQGDSLAKVPTSCQAIYSIAYQDTPNKVLSIAGSSNYLDICTNFNYRELTVKFS